MLKFSLSHIFKARGIKRPYSFLRNLGLSHSVAHRLAHDDVKTMTLDHVGKLCQALHCTPNDLLEWSTEGTHVSSDHPLSNLVRSSQAINLVEELKQIPLDRLGELQEQIKNLKNQG